MNNRLIWILISIILISASTVSAEDKIAFHNFTTRNGMAGNRITSIYRDTRGFLWVGSTEGLNRYDAYRFETFSTNDGVPGNSINNITEDPKGRIWVTTISGSACFDYSQNRFLLVNDVLEEFHFGISNPLNFGSSRDHRYFWAYDNSKISVFDSINSLTTEYPISKAVLTDISQQGHQLYYLTSDIRIFRANLLTGNKEEIELPVEVKNGIKSKMPRLFTDSNDGLWVYTFRGSDIYHLSGNKGWNKENLLGKFEQFNRITQMDEDPSGNIWVTTSHHGLIVFRTDGSVIELTHNPDKLHSLPGNNLISLHIDNDGIVWIGNFKLGLSSYAPCAQTFLHYNVEGTNDIISVCEASDGFYIGTDGSGLLKANHYDEKFIPVYTGANVINCITQDSQKNLWVGTWGSGLIQLDSTGNRKIVYDDQNSGLLSNTVLKVIEKDGFLYLAHYQGAVQRISLSKGEFETLFQESGVIVNDMIETSGSTLLVSTTRGLVEINLTDKGSHFIHANNSNSHRFDDIRASILFKDSKGNVWIAGRKGIFWWNILTDDVGKITVEDGLATESATSIAEDENGQIWIGTVLGISKITLDNGKPIIRNYGLNDGLVWSEFNQRAMLLLNSGEVVAGTPCGLTVILPKKSIMGKLDSPVYLTGMEYERGTTASARKSMSFDAEEIILREDQFPLRLYFSSLDFNRQNTVTYQYRINSSANQWSDGKGNQVEFSVLPPGKYELQVRTISAIGEVSPKIKAVKIIVRAPLFRGTAAKTIYSLLIIAGLGLLFYQRHRRKERLNKIERLTKEAEDQKKLLDMKLTYFANISHELRTPLSLIINPLEEFIKRYPQYKNGFLTTAISNAGYLKELIDQLLSFKRIDAGGETMQYSHLNIVTVLKDVFLTYQSVAENRNIYYNFFAEPSVIEMDFDRGKIAKILHNLLTNAFKFTEDGGQIDVRITKDDHKQVIIHVCDNGIGIPEEDREKIFKMFYQVSDKDLFSEGIGIGLYLVDQYVRMHHGTVNACPNSPHGTVFTVQIPLEANLSISITQRGNVEIGSNSDIRLLNEPSKLYHYTLLLVDDNIEFLDFLSESLASSYKVFRTTEGTKALDILKEEKIDLVISDVMMPNMNGLELCRKIKSDKKTSSVPVILLTAKIGEEFQLEGLNTGADDYITKPFNMDILKMRIEKFIEGSLNQRLQFKGNMEIEPGRIAITCLDQQFIEKAIAIVEENLTNVEFSVEYLADKLCMSRGYLYRRILKITGKSPLEFIRVIKMKRAQQLLAESQLQVSEVAYKLGYNSPKTFTKHFKMVFNVSPSEYIRRWKIKDN